MKADGFLYRAEKPCTEDRTREDEIMREKPIRVEVIERDEQGSALVIRETYVNEWTGQKAYRTLKRIAPFEWTVI